MAYSKIIITQGAVSGASGVSRRGLDLYSVASESIIFSNDSDGDVGVQSWEWALVESPPGSSATFSSVTAPSASLNTDVYGRYVVSLRVNGLGDETNGYSEIVASCSYPTLGSLPGGDELGDWDLPAFSEGTLANWNANSKGAQPEVFRMWRQLREIMLSQYGGNLGLRIYGTFPSFRVQQTDLSTYQWSSPFPPLDLSDYPWVQTVKFTAVFGRWGSSGTTYIDLRDASHSANITGSVLSTTGAGSYLESPPLTIGSSDGDIRNDVSTNYTARIRIVGGTPGTDYVRLFVTSLLLTA